MIDRGDQQQPAGHGGRLRHPRRERPLKPLGQRQPLRQQGSSAELVGSQRDRQLHQGKGVARHLAEQPLLHPRGKRGSVRSQQRTCRRLLQPLQDQLGQASLP